MERVDDAQHLVTPLYTWKIDFSIARTLCPGKGFVFNAVLIQKISYGREAFISNREGTPLNN
jgi:hypothetical protein